MTKLRGGARKGAGRKRIGDKSRIIRARVADVHEQALMLAGNGSISEGIRRLADKHWRLIHGSLKVDQDGNRSKQGDSLHPRDGANIRKSEGNTSPTGGVPQVKEGGIDAPSTDGSVGETRDICLLSPRLLVRS